MSSSPYKVARELIDAAHRKDPAYLARSTHAQGAAEDSSSSSDADEYAETHQDELSYADGVEAWAMKLLDSDPQTSNHLKSLSSEGGLELVRLAARCQHLERFLTPRSTFPEGKAGYLKWRRSLYHIQADRAKELLAEAGVSSDEQELVRKWVSKTDLKIGSAAAGSKGSDPGTQLLEDAAVLVFLQDQLAGFAQQHSDYTKDKVVSILAKTWKKLSPNAKEKAKGLPMNEPLKGIVAEAVAQVEEKEAAKVAAEMSDQQADSNSAATSSSSPPEASKANSSSGPYQLRPKTAAEAEALLLAAQQARGNLNNDDEDDLAPKEGPFGSRLLRSGDNYLTHNAWDHVSPPPEYQQTIDTLLAAQRETRIDEDEAATKYHADAASHWDRFYSFNEHKFFKDRAWLHLEFPELVDSTRSGAGKKRVFEIGCGAGNTIFPLLGRNENEELEVYACDYSREAVQVVKANAMYKTMNPEEGAVAGDGQGEEALAAASPPAVANDDKEADTSTITPVTRPKGHCHAFVWDLSSPSGVPSDSGITPGTLDVVVLIFVLSALHPREWSQALQNVHSLLKPGGLLLFRDYGRHDLPQLRFRKGRMLDENFYVRGDGTRVYFFTPEELLEIFRASDPPQGRLQAQEEKDEAASSTTMESAAGDQASQPHLFRTLQLAEDRRMLVNRKEKKQMYRRWMQAKFQKL